jgi:MFS family permease
MIPLVWKQLPESLDYLLSRRTADTLGRVNHLLARLGKSAIERLPEQPEAVEKPARAYSALLADPLLRRRSILLCTAFFIMMLTFYFVMSWTPKILVDSGLSARQGISGGIVLNLGGIIGSVLLGYFSSRFSLIRLTAGYMLAGGLLMVIFSQTAEPIGLMTLVASGVGFFLFGSMIGLYALAPELYPTDSRAAGISFAMGVGRTGGILSPLLAGMLFDFGLPQNAGYILFALPLMVAVAAVWLLGRLRNQLPEVK